ncbi:MAG: Lrp/AsnC family transcriptional regulator [Halocynthiibacter sp.]
MDTIDKKLMALLSRNARASVTTIAHDMGLARTTVQARIERLERNGIIEGYTVKTNANFRENRIQATVLLQLDPRTGPKVVSTLQKMPEVVAAHTSSGRFDLVLRLLTENTREMDETLDRIGALTGVRSSESLIHLSTKFDRMI